MAHRLPDGRDLAYVFPFSPQTIDSASVHCTNCHYTTVWSCCGGAGGFRSEIPSARSTEAARAVARVTERLCWLLPRSMSTTRTDLRTVSASVAEKSRP